MTESVTHESPLSDRSGVTDAVRVQILATEHWSLLATRSMTWNEVFSRASMFITVLSATVVALALVAQATAFGQTFRYFALLALPIVLILGLTTTSRLGLANDEDTRLIIGMNRLRHAYLELAPELEPYFVTAHNDDLLSVLRTVAGGSPRVGIGQALASTPTLIAAITFMVAGVFAALIADTLGMPQPVNIAVGIVAALATAIGHAVWVHRAIRRSAASIQPRFPR